MTCFVFLHLVKTHDNSLDLLRTYDTLSAYRAHLSLQEPGGDRAPLSLGGCAEYHPYTAYRVQTKEWLQEEGQQDGYKGGHLINNLISFGSPPPQKVRTS